MITTCRPLPRVKLAGRSDVTVVWAKPLPVEKANVEIKAKSEAAKRCGDIMTYLEARTQAFGVKPLHGTPQGNPAGSRSRETNLTIRHTCPDADCIPGSAIPLPRSRRLGSATAVV